MEAVITILIEAAAAVVDWLRKNLHITRFILACALPGAVTGQNSSYGVIEEPAALCEINGSTYFFAGSDIIKHDGSGNLIFRKNVNGATGAVASSDRIVAWNIEPYCGPKEEISYLDSNGTVIFHVPLSINQPSLGAIVGGGVLSDSTVFYISPSQFLSFKPDGHCRLVKLLPFRVQAAIVAPGDRVLLS